MDDIHKEVLQESLTYLLKNLLPKEVLDHLYADCILTTEQLERLHAEPTAQSIVRELVVFMLPKTGPRGFECFINALSSTVTYQFIANFLRDKENTIRQRRVIEAQNTSICNWLRARISLCVSGLTLNDLHTFILTNCTIDTGTRILTLHETLQFVKQILPAALIPDSEEVNVNSVIDPNTVVYVKMTCIKPCTAEVTSVAPRQTVAGNENQQYQSKPLEDWTIDNVCDWLRSIGQTDRVVDLFRDEEIDGYSLARIKESDLEKMNVKVGSRIKIVGKRDECLQNSSSVPVAVATTSSNVNVAESVITHITGEQHVKSDSVLAVVEDEDDDEQIADPSFLSISEPLSVEPSVPSPSRTIAVGVADVESLNSAAVVSNQAEGGVSTNAGTCYDLALKEDEPPLRLPPSEVLRKFDTPVDMTFKYKQGSLLSCVESRPGGNFLLPVHRFVLTDMSTPDGLLEFARETVKFVCACLNDRANGTIHFGIASKDSGPLFSGIIVGTPLRGRFKSYDMYLTKAMKNCFFPDQLDCVLSCVRPPAFIEVVGDIADNADVLSVVEIDVVAQHRWCEDRAFYAKLPTAQKNVFDEMALYRIIEGRPRELLPVERERFMAIKGKLADDRKQQEESQLSCQTSDVDLDLKKKFVHLLCDGEESLRGDHYLILVLNSPDEHMNSEWMEDNISFIRSVEWKAVFDFDSEARICEYLQNQEERMKITMSDEFNPRSEWNIQDPDRLRQLHEDLRNSEHPSWVFVNGYHGNKNEPNLPAVQWKIRKSEGFKEAVRFFSTEIPPNRATIVFLLFSKDTSVILEAAEVFVTTFSNHWLCVADSESIGKPWAEELLRRNCIESPDDRIVLGMPWSHINQTVLNFQGVKNKIVCELPTSTGATVAMKVSFQHEIFDLDILSASQCETEFELLGSTQRQQEQKQKVESEYYRGGSPSWWNFWFQKQVCQRSIHSELKELVQRALKSRSDDVLIERVTIYHQPGAGGSTSARHVLWDLRKFYRVGIVRNITDHQTAEQILKLYQYEDRNPQPVLLLLDNPEDERANLLLRELEEMAKRMRPHDQCRVICVFLVCLRRTQVAKSYDLKQAKKFDPKRITLKHELTEDEREWFKSKSRILQKQYDKQSFTVDPRLLISFNILKENFQKDFIRRMVKDFVADIRDEKERNLLKYISLINAFDLECRPLPSSAFDSMMVELFWIPGPRRGRKAISNRWENQLSSAIRTLLNETSKPAMGHIHSLRIINPLLSKEILQALTSSSGGSEMLSDIALDFFNRKDIFNVRSMTRDNLLRIVKDCLKQRGRLPNGLPETKFSPLIQEIVDKESMEKAASVLARGFNLTEDPFVAQHLARLFIESKVWEKAEEFAKIATKLKPDNSFLWDTYGRIYEQQLLEEYEKLAKGSRLISVVESFHIIHLGVRGMQIFRQVQSISEKEKTSYPNNSGFFGELQMIICLLDCLTYVDTFQDKDDLKRFILDESYVPGDLTMLADVEGENYLEELKKLNQYVETAMNRIEDELIQLRNDVLLDAKRRDFRCSMESLIRLKENFNMYFGEDSDEPPQDMPEVDRCQYRRRRIFRLAGNNLGSIFDLRWTNGGEMILKRVGSLAFQNVCTPHSHAHDYMTLISANLALTSVNATYLYKVKFDDMVSWSSKLYETREALHAQYLEPYLFLTMFNWPRNDTQNYLPPKRIEIALRQWKDAYIRKYPRQCDEGKPYRKKDTTLFFLSNGSDIASIYTSCEERNSRRSYENRGDSSFWRQPDTMRNLQRFQGVLSPGGMDVEVQLQYGQGHKCNISIPTSLPIIDRTMWNKHVFFVIGFSWIGPKAFDITLRDPTLDADMSKLHTIPNPYAVAQPGMVWTRRKTVEEITQEKFRTRFGELDEKLKEVQRLKEKNRKQLTVEEIALVNSESLIHRQRTELVRQRKTLMESRIPEFS